VSELGEVVEEQEEEEEEEVNSFAIFWHDLQILKLGLPINICLEK
jgi:hypothetical protein